MNIFILLCTVSVQQDISPKKIGDLSDAYRKSLIGKEFTFSHDDDVAGGGTFHIEGAYASIVYQDKVFHRVDLDETFTKDGISGKRIKAILQRNDGLYELKNESNRWVLEFYYDNLTDLYKNYPYHNDASLIMAPICRISDPLDSLLSKDPVKSPWRSILLPGGDASHFQTHEIRRGATTPSSITDYRLVNGLLQQLSISPIGSTKSKQVDIIYQEWKGVKYPQQVTLRSTLSDPPLTSVTKFSEIRECTKDPSFFSLTAFGLPEVAGVDLGKSTPVWEWLLAGASVLAAAAGLFRWLQLRSLRKGTIA
ncbi:hypothetical protein [Tuwongella immobilis]|uniref:Uncharacterized protein n=1 Tax=Tuwongella immobilis TaxID=692036 RepID=A0A6C2YUG0_9BACT|nr:hypothetical protein [Tuwongella immobilis]VIP05378.1 unnamed protein product [Tuwongella immobilis]VTS08112.1 unnamed protein product [Tuwongella immobilis]